MPDWLYWSLLVLGCSPVLFVIGWAAFDDWEGFKEAVWYWLKPDIVSWLDGTAWDDMAGEWKLFAFIVVSGLVVFGAHLMVQAIF
ncbi:MAG: hypothetical protein AB8G96_09375 [Phycisphaerales bacterium]